jgi:hypothetical protein
MKRILVGILILGMVFGVSLVAMAGDYKTLNLGDTKKEVKDKLNNKDVFKHIRQPSGHTYRDYYYSNVCDKEAKVLVDYYNKKLYQIVLEFDAKDINEFDSQVKSFIKKGLAPMFTKLYGKPSDNDIKSVDKLNDATFDNSTVTTSYSELFGTNTKAVTVYTWTVGTKQISVGVIRHKTIKLLAFNISGNSSYKAKYGAFISITDMNAENQKTTPKNVSDSMKDF